MKRGTSGLSLVLGINKPSGMSSHDVVNYCRRIFGERRVGHTGTLDPLAEGALLVCVGPATRLGSYLTEHDKQYRFRVAFGAGTDTDDSQGTIIQQGPVPASIGDIDFARTYVEGLVGAHKQMPPVYSAIKVDGQRSYKAARSGTIIELQPRDIELYSAHLEGIVQASDEELPSWDIAVHVSKGTYIRSIARDIGLALGCPAHVTRLQRTSAGVLDLAECISLETLEERGITSALDPVKLLGSRIVFADSSQITALRNGNPLAVSDCAIFEMISTSSDFEMCACTAGVCPSATPLESGEIISVIAENKLVALYEYSQKSDALIPRCVFAVGVSRGRDS